MNTNFSVKAVKATTSLVVVLLASAALWLAELPCRAMDTENAPLAAKIRGLRVFTSPIECVGEQEPSETECLALLNATQAFETGGVKAGFEALEEFLARHPQSAWTPSLRTHLAERYRVMGRYTAALKHWKEAWEQSKTGTDETSRGIAARALTGWMRLLSSVGQKEQVEELLREAERRGLFATPYAPLLYASGEGLSVMKGRPEESYRCGTFAVSQVMKSLSAEVALCRAVREMPSPDGGFRMSELVSIGESNGFHLVAVQRPAGGEIPVPSVVHWKLDHYAAIVEKVDGRYKVVDPTFDGTAWMEASTVNEEASGYFLVQPGNVTAGWRRLTKAEAAAIRGKGYTYTADDDSDNSGDDEEDDDCDPPESNDGPEGDGEPCPEGGMAVWRVSEPHMTLWVHDVPLYYRNARGGWVKLRLSYKHRTVPRNDNIASFGNNWECNWIGFVEQDTAQPDTIKNYLAGGGTLGFATNGTRDYWSGRRLTLNSSGPQIRILSAGGGGGGGDGGAPGLGASFAVMAPRGGSDNHYGRSNSYSAGISRYFLTNRMDRYGRNVSYAWTNVTVGATNAMRLLSMTDKDGKTCTLSYTNTAFPQLITSVADPYGRTAHFKYDSAGRLTNIIDMAELPSFFRYDASGAMTNMVTPYGATSFTYFQQAGSPGAWSRGLEITEPTGEKQLCVYHDGYASGVWHHMESYHWNRHQYAALSPGGKASPITNMVQADFDRAPRTEWMRTDSDQSVARVIATPYDKEGPVDPRLGYRTDYVQFTYPGQSGNVRGSLNRPSRIVWGNQSQVDQMELPRNAWGRPLEFRYVRIGQWVSFTNQYDADGRRLEKVWGPNGEQVRGYGYHPTITNLLTSVTNALGEVMRYSHDAAMRVTSISNFGGLVTTNIYYDSGTYAGFLKTKIDLGFRTNHYIWLNGNLEWHTNELGLATKHIWDNLNRLTSIIYPDSTTISNVYDKLDLVATKDRLNNWTYFGYNSLRQLLAMTNANGRITQWEYCDCGSPSRITEWNGVTPRYTYFFYNMAGRVTNAIFADGYALNYQYNDLGRLSLVRDPAGTEWQFAYAEYGKLQSLWMQGADYGGWLLYRAYDKYDRLETATDRNSVSTTFQYDVLGRLTNRTVFNSPNSSVETFAWTARGLSTHADELGRTNWFVNDAAGRLLFQTNAENQILRFTYNPADQLLALTDGKNQVTKWNYDPEGNLTNKLDQASVEIFRYKYDANGRLTNRWTLAKGDTFYRYDSVGNVTNVDYPGALMDVTLAYDGWDRLTNVVDTVGTTRFAYTAADQLLSEDGPWPSDTVSYGYTHRRRTLLSLLQPNTSPWTQSYAYDGVMRLTNVVSGAGSFGYIHRNISYRVSDQVEYLFLPGHTPSANLYIYNGYDSPARLTDSTLNSPAAGSDNWHNYQYDVAHQRTRQTFLDYNYIDYTYDKIGQLRTAKGAEWDGTPRLHEQFGYEYDAAWNLQRRTNNALVQTFSTDTRNQLTNATRSGTLTVAGKASLPGSSLNNVTVSGTGLSSGAATVYPDGSWARAGATLADGNNSYSRSESVSLQQQGMAYQFRPLLLWFPLLRTEFAKVAKSRSIGRLSQAVRAEQNSHVVNRLTIGNCRKPATIPWNKLTPEQQKRGRWKS
jgi:YD repeat-containing protein